MPNVVNPPRIRVLEKGIAETFATSYDVAYISKRTPDADYTDIPRRLSELRLPREGLVACAETAVSASADVTSNHPNNSCGTYRYHEGTASLRDQFAGVDGWEKETTNNIEAILNKEIGVRVVFKNVDRACSELHLPQPISPQKSATKNSIQTNSLFDPEAIPLTFAPVKEYGFKTYYLLVSEQDEEIYAELSLVTQVTDAGFFSGIAERVFIVSPDCYTPIEPMGNKSDDDDNENDFKISRK